MNLYLPGKLFTSTSLASSALKYDCTTKLSFPAVAKSLALSLSMTVARTGAMWSEYFTGANYGCDTEAPVCMA